jgi:imidazolonepropionase-like amidohydrolase
LFHGKLSNLSDECFRALRETADKRGVGLAMHHTEIEGFKKGIQIGADTLEHCATGLLTDKDVDSFIEKNMAIVPTLKVLGDAFEIENMLSWLNTHGKKDFMPEPLRQSIHEVEKLLIKPYPPTDYKKKFYPDIKFFEEGYPLGLKNVENIKNSGGRIGVGTDTCGTGLSFFGFYYKELEHLTNAGFSNIEALKSATSVNADIIGMSDQVGSIETGKYADFTIVKGDPTTEISAVRNIEYVVKGGVTVFDVHQSNE